jgi:hypothetical protein|tara:strand:+ start:1397 stop:1675 length:279 start_codon:yes stop_codon:yes gene_type:complete
MKCELKTGRKVELKNLTVDEKDELLDSVQYDMEGESVKVKMMHSTMTKFIRVAVKGDTSDKFIGSLSFEEKSEIFTKVQNECMNLGEGKASK